MAGETEDPFGLAFRVDSVHSGSISFGRFENEALCWERRSTFSHNRYHEEVEKCSKLGSVTQKKALFEAHFRNKGFLAPNSTKCQNQIYETAYTANGTSVSHKMSNDDEFAYSNTSIHSAQFYHTMDGSIPGGDHQVTSCEAQVSCYEPQLQDTCDVEYIHEHAEVDGVADVEPPSSHSKNSESMREIEVNHDRDMANLETSHDSTVASLSPQNYANQETSSGILNDQQTSGNQESIPSKSEHINAKTVPRVRDGQRRTYPQRNTIKGPDNNSNQNVRNAPVRSTMEKRTSDKCLLHKRTKYERCSKPKGADEIYRAGKESRIKIIAEPRVFTSQKVSSRVHESTNRSKVAVRVTKPYVRQHISKTSFKCDEHAPRSNPAIGESKKQHDKSSVPGTRPSKSSLSIKVETGRANVHTRKADHPERLGISSCRSSGSGVVSSNKRHEKEKSSSPCIKHRVGEEGKGRSFDGKQLTRMRKSSYEAFSTSSRAADHLRMPIHIAS